MKIEKGSPKSMSETEPRIDEYLGNVEAYVVTEAEKNLPFEKVERWLAALDIASCNTCVTVKERKEEMRMIPGIPRDQKWIRVEPIESWSLVRLEKMAAEEGLSSRREEDGHLIVYGSDEMVKVFIKKMSKPD